jgi:hypothetical protein
MPAIETDGREQKAVVWSANGQDRKGQKKVDQPEEINVRWQYRKSEAKASDSKKVSIDATVTTDRQYPLGSIFWLGEAAELPEDLGDIKDLFEAVSYSNTPDVKGRDVRHELGLMRFKNTLPTVNDPEE